MQFIDKKDDLTFLLAEIIEYGLQPLLKLTAEFCAGNQGAHVQRQQSPAANPFGYLSIHNALGQTLSDSGLAYAGLANEHRVVLGAPLQHLNRSADLFIPADNGIQSALLCAFRQINGILLQSLPLLLGIGVTHSFSTAHLFNRFLHRILQYACIFHCLRQRTAVFEQREDEKFARNELISPPLGKFVCHIQHATQIS